MLIVNHFLNLELYSYLKSSFKARIVMAEASAVTKTQLLQYLKMAYSLKKKGFPL